jgi:hypothetical protein
VDFSLDIWSAVMNAVIFLCLIAIPWLSGPIRVPTMFLGIGGLILLLGFDVFAGMQADDSGMAINLAVLTLSKAVFFFLASLAVEKLFRAILQHYRERKAPEWSEERTKASFARNLRGLKDPDARPKKGHKPY